MLGKRSRLFWKNSTKFGHMDYTSKASAIKLPSLPANTDQEGPKSPKSPLEIKSSSNSVKSPKGWLKNDSEGVGLGILAAMNNSSSGRNAVIASKASISAIQAIPTKNFPASEPIPIVSAMASTGFMDRMIESELSESYTCVIAHFGSNSVRKREYFHQRDEEEAIANQWMTNSSAFVSSPPRFQGDSFHSDDFLNSCNLCKKMLHGQDIYMYRGDTAFCSVECRHQQIVNDEYKEKCVPETMVKPTECSGSPCSAPRLFYAGVVVA